MFMVPFQHVLAIWPYSTFDIEKKILTYGVVITVGCGVATLQGFLIAFVSEVFRVQDSFGLVVNLYRDNTMNLVIGGLLLNPTNRLSEGAKVHGISRLASINLGDFIIGSILDPMGNFIFHSHAINSQYRWVVESPAPGIISRQSVCEPLQTGILSIDSMIPIGQGKHPLELILFLIKSIKSYFVHTYQLDKKLHLF